jgi:hypothetical protein
MESMTQNLFSICKNMPRNTKAFQIARAIVVASGSQNNLDRSFADSENIDPPRFSRTARGTATEDFKAIENGSDPMRKKRTCRCVPDDVIEDVVRDILSPRNVGVLSWGTKPIQIPGTMTMIDFPSTTRKQSMEEMYRQYRKHKEEQALLETVRVTRNSVRQNLKCVGRSTYLDLATTLTANAEKITRSVDYVTDVLINEQVHTLQQIINDVVAPTKKPAMTHGLTLVQNFLKYQYDEHAKKRVMG